MINCSRKRKGKKSIVTPKPRYICTTYIQNYFCCCSELNLAFVANHLKGHSGIMLYVPLDSCRRISFYENVVQPSVICVVCRTCRTFVLFLDIFFLEIGKNSILLLPFLNTHNRQLLLLFACDMR